MTIVFGPPVSLLLETVDLCRMRERAPGLVDAVNVERGSHGTSQSRIEYHFSVNGREVHSTRYAPGCAADVGWSGGANVAHHFPAGRQVTVYFSAERPERCALEYGWFFLSVGMTMIFGGFALLGAAVAVPPGSTAKVFKYAGQACAVYGFALLFVGPPVVRVLELPWHMLAWVGALGVVLLNAWYGRRKHDLSRGSAP